MIFSGFRDPEQWILFGEDGLNRPVGNISVVKIAAGDDLGFPAPEVKFQSVTIDGVLDALLHFGGRHFRTVHTVDYCVGEKDFPVLSAHGQVGSENCRKAHKSAEYRGQNDHFFLFFHNGFLYWG